MIALRRPSALSELIARHGGALDPGVDASRVITTIGASDRDEPCDVAPVLHDRGARAVISRAPLLLVAARVAERVPVGRRWVHAQASRVLAELLRADDDTPVVDPSARIAADVVLGEGARIGANAVIFSGVRIGARVRVGAGAVIGREGFGFVEEALDEHGRPIRIPHRAGVVLGDDVEIGALCTIDAGVLSPTEIGHGTKLDAHVHVGHGTRLGMRCRVAAQVGFAGSVVVDDDVWIGGQAGIADHVHIGRGARIAAKAGVIGDVPAGAVFAGYPAVARARWLRGHAALYRHSR